MGQKKKASEIELKKEEAGTIVKANPQKEEGVNEKAEDIIPTKNPLASIAGKIVPKSLVSKLKSRGGKLAQEKEKAWSPAEIHNRLYELHNLDKKKREKNEAIRKRNIRREEAKCTFRPKISKGSSKMTRAHPSQGKTHKSKGRMKSPNSVFDKLYQNSLKSPWAQKSRKEICDDKFYSEWTFKPDIK